MLWCFWELDPWDCKAEFVKISCRPIEVAGAAIFFICFYVIV